MSRRPIQATIRTRPEDPSEEEGAGSAELREALSYWASGVAVLAASDGDEVDAITVTSFSAVSLDPPLVLVCVNEQSSVLPTILDVGRYTINVLREGTRRTARMVAGRYPLTDITFTPDVDPVLEGSLVSFVCRLWEAYPGGTHRILVGEVTRVELGEDGPPLVYFRRNYRHLEMD